MSNMLHVLWMWSVLAITLRRLIFLDYFSGTFLFKAATKSEIQSHRKY